MARLLSLQSGLQAYERDDGEYHPLGYIPTPARERAALPSFMSYLASVGKQIIPRSHWHTINRRKSMGARFITNQRQSSGCVGWSDAQARMRLRFLRGFPFERLSGAFIYAHINGGRDAGAQINHAMSASEKHGTCLESELDFPHYMLRDITTEMRTSAARRKSRRSYRVDSFDEIVTAIQMNLIPQFPVQVGGSFGRLDSDGVAGVARGWGNHSVHGDGCKLSSRNDWLVDMPNTWGLSFGQEGRVFLSERHFDNLTGGIDAFVHVDEMLDPQATDNPPAPVL